MDYKTALNRAAAYCSQAERSVRDVADKLKDWDVTDDDAERILEFLHEENFINAERFVHAFVNDKFHYERWGRIKITYALRQKGIQGGLVSNTIDDVIDDDEYLETLTDLLRPKLRGMSLPLQQKDRAKLYRFAMQRGFESDVIGQAISNLNGGDGDDDDNY